LHHNQVKHARGPTTIPEAIAAGAAIFGNLLKQD
jgi:hypothetical protein